MKAVGCLIFGAAAMLYAVSSQEDPPSDEESGLDAAHVAASIRETIGFGHGDALVLPLDEETHAAVIVAGIEHIEAQDNPEDGIVALSVEADALEIEILEALGRGEEAAAAELMIQQHNLEQQIVGESMSLMGELEDVSSADATTCENVIVNVGLDPDIRPLALTAAQRSSLKHATRERDLVLKNPLNWHDKTVRAEAISQFELVIAEVLSAEQHAQIVSNRQLVLDNLSNSIEVEYESLNPTGE